MAIWPNKSEEKPTEKKEEPKPSLSPDELLAKMGELLSPIRTSIEQTNTRLTEIENSRKPKEEVKTAEIPSILDDENGAFNARLGPLAVAQIQTNARVTESEVLNEVASDGWSEFLPRIRQELSTTPVQVKASPEYAKYVRNVVDMIIGQEARSGGLKRKGSSFILEDASSSPADPSSAKMATEDKEFLNFEIVTSKGKHVKRSEFLERMGIDIHNPEELKRVRENWSNVQVVN